MVCSVPRFSVRVKDYECLCAASTSDMKHQRRGLREVWCRGYTQTKVRRERMAPHRPGKPGCSHLVSEVTAIPYWPDARYDVARN